MITWEKLDINNLPKGEVLAVNFEEETFGYKEKLVGYLYSKNGIIFCESDNEVLENCTHFVNIHNSDVEDEAMD